MKKFILAFLSPVDSIIHYEVSASSYNDLYLVLKNDFDIPENFILLSISEKE